MIHKICILSDTHGRLDDEILEVINGNLSNYDINNEIFFNDVSNEDLIRKDCENLRSNNCNAVIHAGDIGRQSILDRLSANATTYAVLGNCDNATLSIDGTPLEYCLNIQIEGINIAVAHQYADLIQFAQNSKPDLLVHGHTHRVKINTNSETPIICPGAATITDRHANTPAYIAIIYIKNNQLYYGEIIKIREKLI